MKRILILFVILMVVSSACTPSNNAAEDAARLPEKTGPSLPMYRSNLIYQFSGTQDGSPLQWSNSYSLSVSTTPETRLLEYSESGMGGEFQLYPALNGFVDNVVYMRNNSSSPCHLAYIDQDYDPSSVIDPVNLLPVPSKQGKPVRNELVASIPTKVYAFDAAAFTSIPDVEGNGTIWIAEEGDYIVKYHFELSGGEALFLSDTEGKLTWDYQLQPLDSIGEIIIPEDCPAVLREIPVMDNAANYVRSPGAMSFETPGSAQEIVSFYEQVLASRGYQQTEITMVENEFSYLSYTNGTSFIDIRYQYGNPAVVVISARSQSGSGPSPTADEPGQAPPAEVDPQSRVINSVDLLLGQGSTSPAFSSYHLEYTIQLPVWLGGTITSSTETISADVQGQNVHFYDSLSGKKTEVYMIDGQEYDVANRQVSQGFGLAGLTWTMWPVDLVTVIATGSLTTESMGTESLDGRPVEVYRIIGTQTQDSSGMFGSIGLNVLSTDGTLWVDQATGGLLKATIDFQAKIKDDNGTEKGDGSGHIDLAISQVNAVSVSLP